MGLIAGRATAAWMLTLCFGLSACGANHWTIQRQTTLPDPPPSQSNANGFFRQNTGLAIHLDAQQRLLIYNSKGQYCSEPAPDALAAYAASAGLAASVPTQGAVSAATAFGSAAGSIGLRTQSIQLMRDALYRICEARADGTLSELSATMLLARSQDLTAVVVAVEQLTGAVVASQAALTAGGTSSASAQLVANQQLLDAATKDVEAKDIALKAAIEDRDAKQKIVDQKIPLVAAEKAEADKPGADAATKAKYTASNDALVVAQNNLRDAQDVVGRRQAALADARRVEETIRANRDAALTNATATTAATAQFSGGAVRDQIDKDTAKAISETVNLMVQRVLDKNYITDACATLLTNVNVLPPGATDEDKLRLNETRQFCMALLSQTVRLETTAQANVALQTRLDSRVEQLRSYLLGNDPSGMPRNFATAWPALVDAASLTAVGFLPEEIAALKQGTLQQILQKFEALSQATQIRILNNAK